MVDVNARFQCCNKKFKKCLEIVFICGDIANLFENIRVNAFFLNDVMC